MDPLTIAMLLSAGASAVGALTPQNVQNKQPAPSVGGGQQMNPVGTMLSAMPQSPEQPQPLNTEQLDTGMLESAQMGGQQKPEMTEPKGDVQSKDKNVEKMKEIGDLLSSIPEALSLAAPLLGLGPENDRKQVAPTGGSALQNQTALMYPLPKPPSLGELLAALPRMR